MMSTKLKLLLLRFISESKSKFLLLPVKPFKQSKGRCGPASMKMVLDYFGIKKTEQELSKMVGCTSEKGTHSKRMVLVARRLGLHSMKKDYATIHELRRYVVDKKIPVIVNWFSVYEGHYSVVIGMSHKKICLLDPEFGKVRFFSIDTFKNIWFGFQGLAPRHAHDLVIRRMIVIHP